MNLNLEKWKVISDILFPILTFFTVLLSYFNLREMKKSREESSRPYVIVGYECDEKKFIYLYIKNIGLTSAKNIEVKMNKPVMIKNGTDARKLLFDKTIKCLAPNQSIKTVVFPIWEIPKENGEFAENNGIIEYFDSNLKNNYCEEFEIDIAPEINILYFKKKTMDDLVKAVENLNK